MLPIMSRVRSYCRVAWQSAIAVRRRWHRSKRAISEKTASHQWLYGSRRMAKQETPCAALNCRAPWSKGYLAPASAEIFPG